MASLDQLREEAAGCRACDLWKTGTQTVFGEGSGRAEVMMVGEQPGDREDIEGRPFVGPAGRVLVCLGSVAAQALLGRQFRVTRERGRFVESPLAERVIATVHPSSILRAPDDEARETAMEAFVADLAVVAHELRVRA